MLRFDSDRPDSIVSIYGTRCRYKTGQKLNVCPSPSARGGHEADFSRSCSCDAPAWPPKGRARLGIAAHQGVPLQGLLCRIADSFSRADLKRGRARLRVAVSVMSISRWKRFASYSSVCSPKNGCISLRQMSYLFVYTTRNRFCISHSIWHGRCSGEAVSKKRARLFHTNAPACRSRFDDCPAAYA
jgi:hypothetical protein